MCGAPRRACARWRGRACLRSLPPARPTATMLESLTHHLLRTTGSGVTSRAEPPRPKLGKEAYSRRREMGSPRDSIPRRLATRLTTRRNARTRRLRHLSSPRPTPITPLPSAPLHPCTLHPLTPRPPAVAAREEECRYTSVTAVTPSLTPLRYTSVTAVTPSLYTSPLHLRYSTRRRTPRRKFFCAAGCCASRTRR